MRLASMFLKTLDSNFDSSGLERAFCKTNQLFLAQASPSEADLRDLLDVCQEFFPLPFLMENKKYQQLWSCLEQLYCREG